MCLSKLLRAEPSPCKTFLFVFLKVVQKFGRIENVSPFKPKVPVCLWSELCAMVLLRRVAARRNHGRNDGGKGQNSPVAESLRVRRNVLQMS